MKKSTPSYLAVELFRFFASIKLAVLLLIVFVILLSVATFYEAEHGTPAAQQAIYKTVWFDFLLFLLGVNVLCSALARFPWRKRQTGFVITHIGIIIILVGSLVTRKFGVEGQLMLMEGESSSAMQLGQTALVVSAPQLGIRETINPTAFMNTRIPEGKSLRYELEDSGVTVFVKRYFHNPRPLEVVTPDGEMDNPAIHVALKRPELAAPSAQEWMFAKNPQRSLLDFGIAKVHFSVANTPAELQAILEAHGAKPTNDVEVEAGKGEIVLKDENGNEVKRIDVDALSSQPATFEHDGQVFAVQLEEFMERAKVSGNQLVQDPEGAVNPVVRFQLSGPTGAENHMAFALFPEFGSMHGAESTSGLSASFEYPIQTVPQQHENHLDIILGPEGELHYYTVSMTGFSDSGTVEVGGEINTGWNNLMLSVSEFYPKAKRDVVVIEGGEDAEGPRNNPIVDVRVEYKERSEDSYINFNQPKTLMVGGQPVTVDYGQVRYPLGFTVQLLDFRSPYYPGTSRAMAYESDVLLIDREDGIEREQRIFMNNPLVHDNFKVYQSSYIEGQNGRPDISIFTVARAPGTSTIYVGSIVMCVGMIMIFFSKNYGYRRSSPFISGEEIEKESIT